MLILTRKPTERIRIGEDIVITVVAVKGGQVRLGVDAPRNVVVHREEVYERLNGDAPPHSKDTNGTNGTKHD